MTTSLRMFALSSPTLQFSLSTRCALETICDHNRYHTPHPKIYAIKFLLDPFYLGVIDEGGAERRVSLVALEHQQMLRIKH